VKRWLITGCSGGLGHALALAALRRGDAVAGTSRRAGLTLGSAGDRWIGLQLDVADPDAAKAAVDEAARRMGGLDVVVNNAGYALAGAVEEVSPDEVRAQMEANFLGPLYVCQAALPHLRASGSGCILNIASFAAVQGLPGMGIYSASKFALAGLSEALAGEAAETGVRVTVVEPTGFRTGFAGASLQWASAAKPEYAARRAAMTAGFEQSNGRQPNDPAKAAEALLALADHPEPPLHFGLGFDAEDRITAVLERRLAEYRARAALGAQTAFVE
jgi:NAD(P)-dependent dehydrogenase (short-subunit alcohol dehydrogenase family)